MSDDHHEPGPGTISPPPLTLALRAAFTAALAFTLLAGCLSPVAYGASSPPALVADACNPHPDARDITLPMPGGLSMTFRLVAVPAVGFSKDLSFYAGLNGDAARASQDARHEVRISAPFTGQDLPPAWVAGMDAGQYRFYLIAKYEVSRLQWRAVMEEGFDSSATVERDLLPVTEISWFEAQAFTARYTNWLLAKHPGALPSFRGDTRNTGFVRLPTEVEWEYAARGGQAVSARALSTDTFFPMEKGRALSDYAVYQRAGGGLERIGSRIPNPLGLYDTAGNAAEMTLDCFRLSKDGRLLGAAGGFVRKGGSYLSSPEGVMPGRREEEAFFTRDGAQRPADLGLRPVISAINTPDGGRVRRITEEYRDMEQAGGAPWVAHAEPPSGDEIAFLKNLRERQPAGEEGKIAQEQERKVSSGFAQPFWSEPFSEVRRKYPDPSKLYTWHDHWMIILSTLQCMDDIRFCNSEYRFFNPILDSKGLIRKKLQEGSDNAYANYLHQLDGMKTLNPAFVHNVTERLVTLHAGDTQFERNLIRELRILIKHYHLARENKQITKKMVYMDLLNP